MEDIHIKEIKDTYIQPGVDFCFETGECCISGESFLEESGRFYTPLVQWIIEYFKHKKNIVFNFKLTYFNTSTSKWILTILSELKKTQDDGGDITVYWYFHEDDVDMRDDIINYMEDTGLNINLVPFANE